MNDKYVHLIKRTGYHMSVLYLNIKTSREVSGRTNWVTVRETLDWTVELDCGLGSGQCNLEWEFKKKTNKAWGMGG